MIQHGDRERGIECHTPEWESIYLLMRQQVRDSMEGGKQLSDAELLHRIEQTMFACEQARQFTSDTLHDLVNQVFYAFRGLDVLQPLVDDPGITEIMINSHQELFIERNGCIEKLMFGFESREKLEDIIQVIVSQVNRMVNESTPIVDARLPDGSRVHVILPPIALKGPTVTKRKFPAQPLTMNDLVKKGAIHEEAVLLLRTWVCQ